jgi:succinate dehydrogenase / fumarate reductase cytochrome b subunit
MSSATTTTTAQQPAASFWRARLGSLLAIAPLGVWTVVHLWNNLSAFQGAERWEAAVTTYSHPVAQLVTGLLVLLPLVLHAVWGVARLLSSRPNNARYGFFANFKYLLQRLSAVGVLLFIPAHVYKAMIEPRLMEGHPEPFADIASQMHSHTPTLVVYVLGTLGVSYHLANGVSTFAMGWGLVSSRRALKKIDALALGLFLVLLGMSWGTIYALWRAGGAA